jgi:hypothetical protein
MKVRELFLSKLYRSTYRFSNLKSLMPFIQNTLFNSSLAIRFEHWTFRTIGSMTNRIGPPCFNTMFASRYLPFFAAGFRTQRDKFSADRLSPDIDGADTPYDSTGRPSRIDLAELISFTSPSITNL